MPKSTFCFAIELGLSCECEVKSSVSITLSDFASTIAFQCCNCGRWYKLSTLGRMSIMFTPYVHSPHKGTTQYTTKPLAAKEHP